MEDARTQDKAEEAVANGMDSDPRDCHMTPTSGGVVSENYDTSLEEDAEDAWTKDSIGSPSQTPNIKSPHKPRQEGPRGMQTQVGGTCMQTSGKRRGAEVKGRGRMEFGTTENTTGTREDTGHTSTRRGRATRRRDVEYMVRIRPKLEALMGNVEELLLATVELQHEITGKKNTKKHPARPSSVS